MAPLSPMVGSPAAAMTRAEAESLERVPPLRARVADAPPRAPLAPMRRVPSERIVADWALEALERMRTESSDFSRVPPERTPERVPAPVMAPPPSVMALPTVLPLMSSVPALREIPPVPRPDASPRITVPPARVEPPEKPLAVPIVRSPVPVLERVPEPPMAPEPERV